MTGQRVSDEQFAEWLRQRSSCWNVGMLAFDAVAADLRAARENQRLREALQWTELNFRTAVRGKPVRDMAENLAAHRAALGGGSSD